MWSIRHATTRDTSAIAHLITELGYPTTEAQMRERMQAIGADEQYVSLVATDNSNVVGFIGLTFGNYYEYSGIYARIVVLCVAADARGKGVGRTLVAAAEEVSRSRGALTCVVNSGLHRSRAHAFYEGLGFRCKGKAFYKTLD